MSIISKYKKNILFIFDKFLLFLLLPSAVIMKLYRRLGSQNLPSSSYLLKKIGVFPIRDHYYEPLFNSNNLDRQKIRNRSLPGIKLNDEFQKDFISKLQFSKELLDLNLKNSENNMDFHFNNGSFESGDAEMLYQFIRNTNPSKIIEIGSGNSTKIAAAALEKNKEDNGLNAEHICIEPYEMPWLEKMNNVQLIRRDIQTVDFDWSSILSEGDLLFIDSTHIIQPQGDVLHIYLKILPLLSKGVNIHIHDIFLPNDYLEEWLFEDVRLWNEQYLVETILSTSDQYKILISLNYMWHKYPSLVRKVCPYIDDEELLSTYDTDLREPGSLYLRKL
tara:strand:- start:1849 stop:2847 length:999 start_codon:yes stop_codon:yes gene_type:complete